MKRQLIMLRDLNCPTCAGQLEAAVKKMPGVAKAKVAFAAGTLDVQYDPERVNQDDITNVVRKHGLTIAAVLPGGAA